MLAERTLHGVTFDTAGDDPYDDDPPTLERIIEIGDPIIVAHRLCGREAAMLLDDDEDDGPPTVELPIDFGEAVFAEARRALGLAPTSSDTLDEPVISTEQMCGRDVADLALLELLYGDAPEEPASCAPDIAPEEQIRRHVEELLGLEAERNIDLAVREALVELETGNVDHPLEVAAAIEPTLERRRRPETQFSPREEASTDDGWRPATWALVGGLVLAAEVATGCAALLF